MFDHTPSHRITRDEGERPFWISYADLMTALMVLFLVVMVTTLSQMASTQTETIAPPIELESKPKNISPATTDIAVREQEIGGSLVWVIPLYWERIREIAACRPSSMRAKLLDQGFDRQHCAHRQPSNS